MDNKKLISLVNNSSVLNLFVNLSLRWQDECQYEDFNEYAKIMSDKITPILGCITNVKGTKRPFGIKFTYNERNFHLHINIKNNKMWLSLKAFK